jgi:hypothetical protein
MMAFALAFGGDAAGFSYAVAALEAAIRRFDTGEHLGASVIIIGIG